VVGQSPIETAVLIDGDPNGVAGLGLCKRRRGVVDAPGERVGEEEIRCLSASPPQLTLKGMIKGAPFEGAVTDLPKVRVDFPAVLGKEESYIRKYFGLDQVGILDDR
jgi:hypothetical protein